MTNVDAAGDQDLTAGAAPSSPSDRFGMTVAALAADTVARIDPDATLHDVADALAAGDVGALVIGRGDEVKGIVSERDLVRAIAERRDLEGTRADDIAHHELVWCDSTASIGEVGVEMMQEYVRHILVEEDGQLLGILSMRDLLGAYVAVDDADLG